MSLAIAAAFGGLLGGMQEACAGDFYVGVGVGQATTNVDNGYYSSQAQSMWTAAGATFLNTGSGISSSTSKRRDTATRLIAGFQINPTWAIEAQYVDFGKTKVDFSGQIDGPEGVSGTGETKTDGFGIAGVATLPVSPNFSLIAKVGVFDWKRKFNANMLSTSTSTIPPGALSANSSKRGTDPFYGIGLKYDFSKSVGVQVDWEQYKMDGGDPSLLSASLIWKF